jgi:hypothetical protein
MSIKLPTDNSGLIINLKPYSAKMFGLRELKTVSSQPVSWSPEVGGSVLAYLLECKYPYRESSWPPFQEPLRSELMRFMIALDAYLESKRPVFSANYLISGVSRGSCFAKELKLMKSNLLIKLFDATMLEKNDEMENLPAYHFFDIGAIFNYNFLINWKEPDPEDYLYGWEPLSYDKNTIAELKDEFREILLNVPDPDIIDPIEVLNNYSGSKSIHPVTGQKAKNWKIKNERNRFAESIGIAERMVIQVGPENVRDTVLLSSDSLNTVKLIEQQLQVILESIPESLQIKDPLVVEKKLNDLKNYKTYLMRDITKEGITKPRILLKIALEALNERFPEMKAFQETSFYDDFQLRVNGEIKSPPRGHGLGMANALTTFIQIGIYSLCLKAADSEHYRFEGDAMALALNDDFVVGFESEDDFEAYNYTEDLIFPKLGIIRSKKKSFYCNDSYIIAERYYNKNLTGLDDKESYHRREILNCFTCTNIVQAKQLISSTVSMRNIGIVKDYIEEIVSYWGYEFFPEEITYPTMFGGWFSLNLEGISLDLLDLEKLPFNNKVIRAYRACRNNSIIYHSKDKRRFVPPMIKHHKPFNIPKEFEDILDLKSFGEMNSKFYRVAESPISCELWQNLFNKRQKVFKNFFESDIPYFDFIETVVTDHPNKTFYPNSDMIEGYIEGRFITGSLRDVYLSRNPKTSLLKKYNTHIRTEELGESFSVNFTKKETLERSMNSEIRKRLKGSIFNAGREDFSLDLLFGIYESEEIGRLYDSYLSPQALARISSMIEVNRVPILKERYRSPLIKEKKAIYGRFLLPEEQFQLQGLKRTLIKDIITLSDREGFDIEEILEELTPPEEEVIEFIEEPIADTRDVSEQDFWTWRTDPYPIDEPFNTIFKAAHEAILLNSIRRNLPDLQGDRNLNVRTTFDTSVSRVAQSMSNFYPMDTMELSIAIRLYSDWEKQSDIFEAEEFSSDFDALFGG